MISVFDLFSIGIGPSSSHTVGPMKAALAFVDQLRQQQQLGAVTRVKADLYGSLALTGQGHGTVSATLLGLEGKHPRTIEPALVGPRALAIQQENAMMLAGTHPIPFDFTKDLLLHKHEFLPKHANGMRFSAFDSQGKPLLLQTWYSIGGGFVVQEEEFGTDQPTVTVPFPFSNADELLAHCRKQGKSIASLVWENERARASREELRARGLEIAQVMHECVAAGCRHEGILPGGLNVRRRAPSLYKKLSAQHAAGQHNAMLWPMLYAMAVNEENAAGGRVVTAPTNGAAGIVPAVLEYYRNYIPGANDDRIIEFLLTAGAIGLLYKMNASISGAEVGCQGEVGVACSMAAGALAAVMGGTLAQVENAAEIAMEHHLGMTCDPVGGLVQIPCIERNGIAAEQAIKIAQLALLEDGDHKVSLDTVIQTMYETGKDMQQRYKETSQGGLAVNVIEC
ncbi:L-serine dehydratase [Chitinivorax tropicus]|uniref:L-serine dehydratase n=2 Tax=Chitinivorax tropicus TaxID=714531 RepID=A0A840MJK8_9PROT|nr:L-serine ammonia-lyase [Chitinivorax tropicus]MBB5018828.1 L-serine dehydratase [Chitinivorax tropicus]